MKQGSRKVFWEGIRNGFPIGAGYFAVSFALGIMAKKTGLTPLQGWTASLLTNASAGEYAGLQVIAENAGIISMILMTIVASARYLLMGCALAQRLDPAMKLRHRFLIAFDLTDEIFGAEIARTGMLEPAYAYGLFVLPLVGWSFGTMLGIVTGNLLPTDIVNALSVALYGMFIAIIIPPARKNPVVAGCVAFSFLLSFLGSRLSLVSSLSSGTRTLILTVVIASAAALFFPVKEGEHE